VRKKLLVQLKKIIHVKLELYNPTNYIFEKDKTEKLSKPIPAKFYIYGGGNILK
jgi:alcohol dehydrogenase YqhD (iron-dependent ADH family)